MFLFVLHFSVMKAFHLLYHSAKNLKTLPGGPKPSPTPIKDPCGWSFLLRSSMEKEVYIYILSHLLRKPTTLWEDPKPPHPLPTKPDRHPGRYPLLPRCPGKKKFHLVSHTPNKPTALPEDVNSGKDLSGLPLLLQYFTARVLRLLSPAFHARHKPITLWEPPTPPPPPPPPTPIKDPYGYGILSLLQSLFQETKFHVHHISHTTHNATTLPEDPKPPTPPPTPIRDPWGTTTPSGFGNITSTGTSRNISTTICPRSSSMPISQIFFELSTPYSTADLICRHPIR
jgi:hypothetical protein